MVNNKNLHTLKIGSHFELPPGGAERLAKSNIHTLMLATAKSASRVGSKDIEDYKILLGSKTLKSLTLTCGSLSKLSQHLPMLKEEIENCEINNLDIRDNLIRVHTEPYALLGDSRRLVSDRKISLLLNHSSWREEFKWVLEPKFFQDISIAFGGDLNVSEEFFKLLMVHPGRVQMYLNSPSPDQRRREHSARISECRTLDTLKVYGWDRSDLEKFVGHPKLATLILHSFSADAGLELLKGIPGLNYLYLGSGLTGKMAEGLENNHTIKKIGLEYTALTEDIAKSLVKVLHLSTVDLRRINLSPGSLREEVSALKVLLSAPGITKIYVPIRLRDIFSAPDLVELTRNSSAGRIEFWSDHSREHGPELPPPTPTAALNPQLLA